MKRLLSFVFFVVAFAKAFLLSNLTIAKAVVFQKRESFHPGFVKYDVSHLSQWELFLLSHCITLTPGTTSVELVDNNTKLVVHAFDAQDPQAVRASIRTELEEPLLRFVR
jgi:multicomponent Na+:H+ antiporter subunit E